ncbi:MAG TPA: SCO family protein [Ferruginibacter sp.]|nr:SCO family protein [Ferruginibacter sp.]
MKKQKWWIYIIFFIVLLGGFYLAIFRDHQFSDSKLAVINASIPAFNFTTQDGKLFTPKNTANKVYVAEYFFTTCKGICPKMNANMRRVYDTYKDVNDFLIVSHTCMPETDSTPLLKAYEQKMLSGTLQKNDDGSYKIINNSSQNAAPTQNTNWYFVTGDKAELYKLARQGYMIDNGKPDSTQRMEDQFIHTQFFAVVDRYGRVRGIYDGLKEDEVQKLIVDIKGLLREKVDPSRFLNGFSSSPN